MLELEVGGGSPIPASPRWLLSVVLLLATACADSAPPSSESSPVGSAFPPPWPAAQPSWSDEPAREWPGRRPRRVIVLGIDTLRADHLQGFGAERRTAPNLAALSAERGAFRFLQAYAQASWTLPSMTSVFTSLYPPQHQVEDRGLRLSPDIPTLAGAFAAQGWMTAGFVTHIYVSSLFGLDSGFLTFRELSIDWNYREGKQLRAQEVMSHVVP